MNTEIIALISRIRENANKFLINELKKADAAGLSPSHGDILAVLLNSGTISMHELAEKIHRTKATTTVLADKLEQSGYVKREKTKKDARYTTLTLTRKGQNFREKFIKISDNLNTRAFRGLSEAEIKTLEVLLQKIRSNLE